MATNTTNYKLVKPTDNEAADINTINSNMDVIDSKLESLDTGKESLIKNATEKNSIVDADTITLSDSTAAKETKSIKFANIKTNLNTYFDTLYNKTVIANNLTTTMTGSALDAIQGKSLADSISVVNTSLTNQSKAQNIAVSATTQNLYGVANVDIALQKIKNTYINQNGMTVVEFLNSQTWNSPIDGAIEVFLCGGGGHGGNGGGSAGYSAKGGGGGGGFCGVFKFKVSRNQPINVVIGAGGTSGDGGNTSFGDCLVYGGHGGDSGDGRWVDGNGGDGASGGGKSGGLGGTKGGSSGGKGFGNAYCYLNNKYYGDGGDTNGVLAVGAPNTGKGGSGATPAVGSAAGGSGIVIIGYWV